VKRALRPSNANKLYTDEKSTVRKNKEEKNRKGKIRKVKIKEE